MKRLTYLLPSLLFAVLQNHGIAQTPDTLDPDAWPHSYKINGSEVAIYMPQIIEWKEFKHLKANAAIAVKLKGSSKTTYGVTLVQADTATNVEQRKVSLGKKTFGPIRFPELSKTQAAETEKMVRSILTPESPMTLPLDSVLTAIERADAITRDTKVSTEPPPIYHSTSPALLLTFIGDPKLERVRRDDPSLMFAINTNWDVLFDTISSNYYLLAEDRWFVTKDLLKGTWAAATSIPPSFHALPNDDNWSEVKARLYISPSSKPAPKIFSTNRPSEIILTDGQPQLTPISGTKLLFISNSQSDVFLDLSDNHYYYLTCGRWFSATDLNGPWTYASMKLPSDFFKIPANHPKGYVLSSVPGTPQADEAVILASIPQTAKVSRAHTNIHVAYNGEPHFQPIPKADEVSFATNTSYDVFLCSQKYYCCYKGVWFTAPKATGTWAVCDKVPAAIYTIPPESPKYNVTHVYVYDFTPDTVQVGVTSGYSGSYVAQGLVVFGLGYWIGKEIADDYYDYWHRGPYYPRSSWYGYGCGAYYNTASGGYYGRGAYCYGPYGGAGHGAAYNPATGTFARGSYAYGPYNSAGARAAYNPWTNTGARQVGASTPYGSWSHSSVVHNGNWISGSHASNQYGSIGGVQTSRGGAAVGVNRTYGSDSFAAKTASGDVYVGHDGNIYKKDNQGRWNQRQNGSWNKSSTIKPYQNPQTRTSTTRHTTTRTSRHGTGFTSRRSTSHHLNRDVYSRSRSSSRSHSNYTRSSRNHSSGSRSSHRR